MKSQNKAYTFAFHGLACLYIFWQPIYPLPEFDYQKSELSCQRPNLSKESEFSFFWSWMLSIVILILNLITMLSECGLIFSKFLIWFGSEFWPPPSQKKVTKRPFEGKDLIFPRNVSKFVPKKSVTSTFDLYAAKKLLIFDF